MSKIILVTAIMLGTLCTSVAYSAEHVAPPASNQEGEEPASAEDVEEPVSKDDVEEPASAEDVEEPVSDSARLMDRFDEGEYWSVGSEGVDLLKKEPDNAVLRMAVADSLAWTGRYAGAISQYQMLAGTPLADGAALGLANVFRWSGRPDLASPLYQQTLRSQPDNPEALEGLDIVDRELRPRTDITAFRNSDSDSVRQHGTELHQHWRGDNRAINYEFSLSASRYTMAPETAPFVTTPQRELNFSVEHLGMALAPKLDLSVQQEPFSKAFGSLRLKLVDAPDLHVTIGHVNWGNMEFQPQALLAGLVATQLGFDGSLVTYPGTISVAYNNFQVSDGNRVQDGDIKFFPSYSPFDPEGTFADFKYYIGLEDRRARRNVPIYWSPGGGYVSGNIGFTDEWIVSSGAYSIYGERGTHVAGEALTSYNLGFSAKRYVGHNWGALLSAGMLRNQRVGAYRSKYLTFGVERLW